MALGLLVGSAVTVQATADSIDQMQALATGSNTLRTPMAQTFKAGATTRIDRVAIMGTTTSGPVSLTVQLQTVSGGKPSGTVLGSSSFTGMIYCCHAWHDFAFNPTVSVTAGTEYAIVVRPTSGLFTWYDSYSYDAYANGQLWLASGSSWTYQTYFGRDFCFETFVVAGGTNGVPTLTAASSAVATTEGSPVSNIGTYSDTDGDAVTLSASAGALNKTGTSSGTWTWSQPASDEAPVQTITITANDGRGATATTSFTVSVTGLPPTVTITGAPASGPEGTAVKLTGIATSPSAADNAAGFTLAWTVTKNGNPFAAGTGSTFTFTPDDEGTFVATFQAVDDGGNGSATTATITGANVAPSATITSTHTSLVLVAMQPVTFTGGFMDPGQLDTHTGSLDFGDGTPADTYTYGAGGSGDFTDSHGYASAGTYTFTYSVTDDDGGVGTVSATLIVQTAAYALNVIDGYVQGMASLNGGEKNSLSAKLRAAAASVGRGDTNTACNQLDALLNELVAQTKNGKLLGPDSANISSSVWAVHRALGCTKMKVGWLTLTL